MTRLVPLAGVIVCLWLGGCMTAHSRTTVDTDYPDGRHERRTTDRGGTSVSAKGAGEVAGGVADGAASFLSNPLVQGVAATLGIGGPVSAVGALAASMRRTSKERHRSREQQDALDAAYDAGRADTLAVLHPGPGAGAVRPQPASADPRGDGDTAGPT